MDRFLFETLYPPHWSELDQRFYRYRLYGGWVERTNVRGHLAQYPAREHWVCLMPNGDLWIRDRYLWDGPSGLAIDTANFMRASLVHDCLYQLIEKGELPSRVRSKADSEMRRICKEDGMGFFRRWYAWAAVRFFGGFWLRYTNQLPGGRA